MKTIYQWHFARPALAKQYLQYFSLGLTSARGLFARRRMGKTEFLKQDLIPLAKKEGYQVVYINLWDLEKDPETELVSEFYKIIAPKGWKKLKSPLKISVNSLKATGKIPYIGEGSLEASLTPSEKVSGTLLKQAMQQFDETNDLLMLVIDEAQVLAYEENSHFAHALRAGLDIRKDHIKVIFAGSSENTLRRMFGVPSEPFYNWAPLEPFELLGQEFVGAMVEHVNHISKYPLALEDAQHAFSQLKNTPEFFRRYIEHYIIHPTEGSEGALKATLEKVFNDKNFKQQWNGLLAVDKILLSFIANGTSDFYGKETLHRLSAALGIAESINKNTVQNALIRLSKNNIITKIEHGSYQFEDEAFADWIKYHDD